MKLSYDDAFFSKYTPSEKAEVWDRLVAAADKFGGKIEMVGYECFEDTAAREGLLRELKANYTKKEGEDEEDEEETSE